jgi:hypothetical protein
MPFIDDTLQTSGCFNRLDRFHTSNLPPSPHPGPGNRAPDASSNTVLLTAEYAEARREIQKTGGGRTVPAEV